MIVVVMGVAGSGKTTIGRALAARLGWTFLDADDFHPPDNVAKMRSGQPLTDADREPWLDAMRAHLMEPATRSQSAVLACSALKRAYRQRLEDNIPALRWVYLRIDRDTARARLMQRHNHFMPTTLIDSQFATLEPPTDALTVDAHHPLETVVDAIVRDLGMGNAHNTAPHT